MLVPPTAPDELIDAAVMLEDAVLDVTAQPGATEFALDVGLNGTIRGLLKEDRSPRPVLHPGHRVRLPTIPNRPGRYSTRCSTPTRSPASTTVRATRSPTADLGGRPRDFPFPNWSFEDFASYTIEREKPPFAAPGHPRQHRKTRRPAPFAWVVNRHRDGLLICDDGPGETADFLLISPGGAVLKMIHVKGEQPVAAAGRAEPVRGRRPGNATFTIRLSWRWCAIIAIQRRVQSSGTHKLQAHVADNPSERCRATVGELGLWAPCGMPSRESATKK